MNQILIIRNLNSWIKGEKPLLNMSKDGWLTPDWMIEKGLWSCYTCGCVNSVDCPRCKDCNDEKFVLTESNKSLFIEEKIIKKESVKKKKKYKPRLDRRKAVINTETKEEYRSIGEASEATGLSYAYVSGVLNGRYKNFLKLKWLNDKG